MPSRQANSFSISGRTAPKSVTERHPRLSPWIFGMCFSRRPSGCESSPNLDLIMRFVSSLRSIVGGLLVANLLVANLIVASLLVAEAHEEPEFQPIPIAAISRDEPVSFAKEIHPLLKKHCVACHNSSEAKAKLNLETP